MVEVSCVSATLFLSLYALYSRDSAYLHVAVGLSVFESTVSERSTASEEKERKPCGHRGCTSNLPAVNTTN
jgi:hypothetical protein